MVLLNFEPPHLGPSVFASQSKDSEVNSIAITHRYEDEKIYFFNVVLLDKIFEFFVRNLPIGILVG